MPSAVQLAGHVQRELNFLRGPGGVGHRDPAEHTALLVDHARVGFHRQPRAIQIAAQRPVGEPADIRRRILDPVERELYQRVTFPPLDRRVLGPPPNKPPGLQKKEVRSRLTITIWLKL